MTQKKDVRDMVRRAYGEVAQTRASCCGPSSPCRCSAAPSAAPVPEADMGLSCGDPVAFAEIQPGDVVLDLGSGGGKDVFLAAEKAGAKGRAIGVDMTPEMLALAQENAKKFAQRTGLRNVEFRRGEIENLPVEDASADLVISNCVINLSPDKPRVFREIYRALKPGGRMVISDIVLNRKLPQPVRNDETFYVECIAGALPRGDYLKAIADAGFERISTLSDRLYGGSASCCGPEVEGRSAAVEGVASSITVRAIK